MPIIQSLIVACCLATSIYQNASRRFCIIQPFEKTLDQEVKIHIEQLPLQVIELEAKAIDQIWFSMGGTRATDAKASRDSWKKTTSFFQETLKSTETNKMKQSNQEKFSVLRKFNLPRSQYAITGSGPLGIRNLKIIGDIDIIVTPQLWDILAKRYGIVDENGVKKIILPGGIVEAFYEGSFYTSLKDDQAPTFANRIANAEIIDELPFDSLENILYYKRKEAREKDLKDILLIEQLLQKMSLF
jgi:hypothetical protein